MKAEDFEVYRRELFESLASKDAETIHDIRNILALNQCLNGLQQDELLEMIKSLYDYKTRMIKCVKGVYNAESAV
jgi:flagellin-specific chaperone FliS